MIALIQWDALMFSNNTTKDLKHILNKNNEESRFEYIFSHECDIVESVTIIRTPLSVHYIVQLATFTKNQSHVTYKSARN